MEEAEGGLTGTGTTKGEAAADGFVGGRTGGSEHEGAGGAAGGSESRLLRRRRRRSLAGSWAADGASQVRVRGAQAGAAAEGDESDGLEDRGGEAKEGWLFRMIVMFGGEERRESGRRDKRAEFEESHVDVFVGRSRATKRRASWSFEAVEVKDEFFVDGAERLAEAEDRL
jgi:hypothetical protein